MVLNVCRFRSLGCVLGWVLALLPAIGSATSHAASPAAAAAVDIRYISRTESPELLKLDAPQLPDLAPYTLAAVRAKIDRTPRGRVRYQRMADIVELSEFTGGDQRIAEWARRQGRNPLIAIIEGGYVTPRDLARALAPGDFIAGRDGTYLLRVPLFIRRGASFHIDRDVRDFRLSEERGSFIVNDGQFFLTESALTAWRETTRTAAHYRPGKPEGGAFRPFYLAWGGTRTYMAASRVTSLGYAASKSYGVSISQYSPSMIRRMNRSHPGGWIIDSEFIDLWYGFYCYETEDFVLARNQYIDNIVYGIDPHDRSRRLIIAENEARGTRKKHGIIVSREVNDSWIFRNRSHHNTLSGFVIDRASVNNVIADNTAYNNASDGFTVYESSDNLFWNNVAIGNARHGFRVRNSQNVRLYGNHAIANGATGIFGHIKDLNGTDRDLLLDPFNQRVSLTIVGGKLIRNARAPFDIDRPVRLHVYDVDILSPSHSHGLRFSGILKLFQTEVLDLLVRRRLPVVIEPARGEL